MEDQIQEQLDRAGEACSVTTEVLKMDGCRLTSQSVVDEEVFLFKLFDTPCFPRGDLTTITGPAKSGKTFLVSMLMACCVKRRVLALERVREEPLKVVWLDTEQSRMTTKRILTERVGKMIATDYTDSTDDIGATDNTDNTEKAESIESTDRETNTEKVMATENTDNTEKAESADKETNTEKVMATENTDNTDKAESTDKRKATDNTDNTEKAESTDKETNTESADNANNTDKAVAVVESEKTAVIMSELYRDYLWVAAGGLYELTPQKLFVLRGRKVVLFPDTDPEGEAFKRWYDVAHKAEWLLGQRIFVSPLLEQHATAEQKLRKIDILDFYFSLRR